MVVDIASMSTSYVSGPGVPGDIYVSVPVLFLVAEVDRQLAAYDPASGTSPSVANARPVLRAILDELAKLRAGDV